MVTYEYRCQQCSDEMEVEATLGGAPRALPCSSCGGRAARILRAPLFSRSSANAEDVYNPSLGITHRTDKQAAEHIKMLNDTQGTQYSLE